MEQSEFLQRVRLAGNPQPHPAAVVKRGGVRFTVLTSRLLRLEWSPTGIFTDDATFAFPNRAVATPPTFAVSETDDLLQITTEALHLTYQLNSGPFTAANLLIALRGGSVAATWRPGQAPTGNLGGTRRTLDDTGGDVPLEPGLISRDGWVLFDDSQSVVFPAHSGWVEARPTQSVQDWYFFGYGHAYTDALSEYLQFGGTVPLIPRYALGIWWSRYWPYSDEDLKHHVATFAEHRLPLDVLVVDMDWHTPGYWTGYTWNSELFPDPAAFLAEMHRNGLHVTLNLHPADGVQPHEAAYPAFRAALGPPESDNTPIPFRITDRQFAELYFTLLHHPLEDQGVDFWWIDWQQGANTDIVGLDPLIWLNHLHFADARRRGQRPFLFSRWGGLGNQRYPLGFSGDTFGGWTTLAALPRFTATAANVDFGWWSHDIGGHFGAVEPELFVRWIQFGALSPCLRLHATKDPLGERRPWVFAPPILAAIRQAFELRYRLLPYLYTMARHTYDRGSALCRPMYHAYPEDDAAYAAYGQYMLGDDLIAAPITQPADAQTHLAVVDVWLPPGEWYRFDSGEAMPGPRWARFAGDLTTIPLFARAGAIVPLAQTALHLADQNNEWHELRLFPIANADAGGNSSFRLYQDDGVSESYVTGSYEWTTIQREMVADNVQVVRILPVEGSCPALTHWRAFKLTFVAVDPPATVSAAANNGLDWLYDSATHSLHCEVPLTSKHETIEITVRWPAVQADSATHGEAAMARYNLQAKHEHLSTLHSTPASAPFVHAIAHTAWDEAQHTLGSVILVPPYDANGTTRACAVALTWHQLNHAGIAALTQPPFTISEPIALAVPFTLDPDLQTQRWEVRARFSAGDELVTATYTSPTLQPPIQRWQVRYAGQDQWSVVQADAETNPNIANPYFAVLHPPTAAAATSGHAQAFARILLSESTTAAFATMASGSLALEVDGQILSGGEPQATLLDLAPHWPVTRWAVQRLTPGSHDITVHLTAPASGLWGFSVVMLDEAGQPLLTCNQMAVEPA